MIVFGDSTRSRHAFLASSFPFVRGLFRAMTPATADQSFLFVAGNGMPFNSVVHFVEFCKMSCIDPEYAEAVVLPATTPQQAKAFATKERWLRSRHGHGTRDELRREFCRREKLWFDDGVVEATEIAQWLKFEQNPQLKAALLATEPCELVEASPTSGRKGVNVGRMLMHIRLEMLLDAEFGELLDL